MRQIVPQALLKFIRRPVRRVNLSGIRLQIYDLQMPPATAHKRPQITIKTLTKGIQTASKKKFKRQKAFIFVHRMNVFFTCKNWPTLSIKLKKF